MSEAAKSVDEWVTRIQKTRSSRDLLRLLAEFRKFEWTDVERQRISHTYMRVLDVILKTAGDDLKKAEATSSANDGPVWYEKM